MKIDVVKKSLRVYPVANRRMANHGYSIRTENQCAASLSICNAVNACAISRDHHLVIGLADDSGAESAGKTVQDTWPVLLETHQKCNRCTIPLGNCSKIGPLPEKLSTYCSQHPIAIAKVTNRFSRTDAKSAGRAD
jgi:hypothetical protein